MVKTGRRVVKIKLILATALALGGLGGTADAALIDWTQWNTPTAYGASGGAVTGSGGISYAGELQNLFFGSPSWGPPGTFNGGTISNAPPPAGGIIQLFGGGTTTDTISFATPVIN